MPKSRLRADCGGIALWCEVVALLAVSLAGAPTGMLEAQTAPAAANVPATGPAPASASAPASAADSSTSAAFHGVIRLDGPWSFQMGDDPRWADPAFDDSSWPKVVLDQPLSDQGIDTYSGYAWYRLKLSSQQLTQLGKQEDNSALRLLLASDGIGQLGAYIDGLQVGQTRGMTENPSMYESPPLVIELPGNTAPASASGSAGANAGARTIAIRAWAGPGIPIKRGLLAKVELSRACSHIFPMR